MLLAQHQNVLTVSWVLENSNSKLLLQTQKTKNFFFNALNINDNLKNRIVTSLCFWDVSLLKAWQEVRITMDICPESL